MLLRYTFLCTLTVLLGTGEGRVIPCLEECTCETNEHDPVIRCDGLGLNRFPLPQGTPMKGYHFLALTCNEIEFLPAISMIKAAFPDLQGIDVQGNSRLNCSALEHLEHDIPVLSDCMHSEEPLQCDKLDKNCDWRCRALDKLRDLWQKFKKMLNNKIREWGAEDTVEAAKSWFSKQFDKVSSVFDDSEKEND